MISIDKVTEIFCIADDFCKEFDAEVGKYSLKAPDGRKHLAQEFPTQLSYTRFVEVESKVAVPLALFLQLFCFGECTGISFLFASTVPSTNLFFPSLHPYTRTTRETTIRMQFCSMIFYDIYINHFKFTN